MAVSIEDIKKLRAMTGAGLADVKKALTEAEGDFDKAKELLRERGLAIAAKRSDRETSNGCVLVKKVNDFAAIIALKCETDFVANGADFIKLTSDILDAAIAAKCHTLDEVKALALGESDVQAAVTHRSGITGEKMELDGYNVLEGENIEVYDAPNPVKFRRHIQYGMEFLILLQQRTAGCGSGDGCVFGLDGKWSARSQNVDEADVHHRGHLRPVSGGHAHDGLGLRPHRRRAVLLL